MPDKMTDLELVSIVDAEFESSLGKADGEISQERAKALDFYMSRPLGNEVKGQSQVVTSDVSDVVDGILPSLLRVFASSDNLLYFEPHGEEDIEQAKQESDYINYLFFRRLPWFVILYTWFMDALIQKNGIVKCWWDTSEEVTTESYKGLNEVELAIFNDDEELEPEEAEERTEIVEQPVMTAIGQIMRPVEQTVFDVTYKRTKKTGRVCVEGVPPEEFRISADARSVDPAEARMTGHEREPTRSELVEMGFDKKLVDSLPAVKDTVYSSPEKIARHDKADESNQDAVQDKSQERVQLREAYIKVDYDGDGRSELRQVFVSGNEVLSNEVVDRSPFHVLTPHIMPHKFFGMAAAEKVMDLQEINTTLVRQILMNLYHTNQPGHGVWEQGMGENTLDDLLTTQVGRVVRFNRPVGDSWAPMSVPFTAGATFPMLEYYDKVKARRTGVRDDGEGLSPDQLKNIQQSVMMQSADMSQMKVEVIARVFAETGIKSLFLHMHELTLKCQDEEDIIELRGKFVPVDPREWRTRKNMIPNVGLGVGSREQNLMHIAAIAERQKEIVANGGMNLLVTPQNIYATAEELVKNSNRRDPQRFFTDPGDAKAPPPSGEQEQLMRAQLEIQKRQQELDAQEQQLKAVKIQLDAQEKEVKANIEAQGMMLQHQRELERIAIEREKVESTHAAAMETIATKLTELEIKFQENVPGAKV